MNPKIQKLEERLPEGQPKHILTPQEIQESFGLNLTERKVGGDTVWNVKYLWKGEYQGNAFLWGDGSKELIWSDFYPNKVRDFSKTGLGTYAHLETLVALVNKSPSLLDYLADQISASRSRRNQLERLGLDPTRNTVRDEILKPMAYLEARGFKFEGVKYDLVK